jgi:hypothetical protein
MRQWSHFGRSDDGLSADLARQWTRPYYYGMTLITLTLATLPALVTLAVTAGRIVASLAREARIITVLWLALRGTRPDERAEIIRALAERSQRGLGNNDSASRLAAAGTRRRERVPKVTSDGHAGLRLRSISSGADKVANGPGPTVLVIGLPTSYKLSPACTAAGMRGRTATVAGNRRICRL